MSEDSGPVTLQTVRFAAYVDGICLGNYETISAAWDAIKEEPGATANIWRRRPVTASVARMTSPGEPKSEPKGTGEEPDPDLITRARGHEAVMRVYEDIATHAEAVGAGQRAKALKHRALAANLRRMAEAPGRLYAAYVDGICLGDYDSVDAAWDVVKAEISANADVARSITGSVRRR